MQRKTKAPKKVWRLLVEPEIMLLKASLYLLASLFRFVKSIFRSIVKILILYALGVALIELRNISMQNGMLLAAEIDYITVIYDIFITFFTAIKDAIIGIIDVVRGIEKLFDPHIHPKYISMQVPDYVSQQTVRRFVSHLITECAPYDSAWRLFQETIKMSINTKACNFIRYFYAYRPVYDTLDALIGWAIANPDPKEIHSCEITESYSVLCIIIGVGYVVLDILLPLYLVVLLLSSANIDLLYFIFYLFTSIILLAQLGIEFIGTLF